MRKGVNATSRMAGTERRRHEYGEQISCLPKASAHAATALPRFGKYLSVSIGGGEKLKGSASYMLDIAEFESWSSVSTCPPSPGYVKLGVAGMRMDACRNLE